MFFGGVFLNLFKYLTTAAAISLITAVTQMILPDGKMKKTIKVVFQLILIVCLVTPLFNGVDDFNLEFNKSEIALDYSAINSIFENKIDLLENDCEKALEKEGILGVKITILKGNDENIFTIEKVIVNFDNLRITAENEHIDITRKTVILLCELLSVNEEVIIIE